MTNQIKAKKKRVKHKNICTIMIYFFVFSSNYVHDSGSLFPWILDNYVHCLIDVNYLYINSNVLIDAN